MANKDNYRFVKLNNVDFIKEISKEVDIYISESINKSKIFSDTKKEEIKKIEDTKKIINNILAKLRKLDSHLDKKAL